MVALKKKYSPLFLADTRYFLITGGRGSGKSFSVSAFLCLLSFEEKQRILYTRQTMTSAHLSIIPEFTEKIDLIGASDKFSVTKLDIRNKDSGSDIIFKGIQSSRGSNTANLKSLNAISCWVLDEAEEMVDEKAFDTINLSVRQADVQNRVILIMNPTDDEHFIYKKFIQNTHKIEVIDGVEVQISTFPNITHIHSTYMDNEENLSPEFLEEVANIKRKSIEAATDPITGIIDMKLFQKTKYAYTIIGRWNDVAEGVIFDNWEEGEFDTSLPYIYGADFGHSIDPTTLVKIAVDKKRKRVYVHEEYYKSEKIGLRAIYAVFSSRIGKKTDLIVGDSQEERLIQDLKDLGLNIEECEKGPGSVVAGITDLLDFTLVISPESFNAKKEVKNYKWSDKKAKVPMDANNHIWDPVRYGFRKLAGYKISNRGALSRFG